MKGASISTKWRAFRAGFRHGMIGVYHVVPATVRRWYDIAFKLGTVVR